MIEIVRICDGRRLIETIDPWPLQLRAAPRNEHDHIVLTQGGAVCSPAIEPVRRPSDCWDMYGISSKRNRGQQPRQRFSRESIRFAA